MSKLLISADEAEKLLPRRRRIHTFIRIFGWQGDNVDRDELLQAFRAAKTVEVSPEAACFDHYLAVKINGMMTYVETNLKAMAKLGLVPTVRQAA